jgi:hypothetical protein
MTSLGIIILPFITSTAKNSAKFFLVSLRKTTEQLFKSQKDARKISKNLTYGGH